MDDDNQRPDPDRAHKDYPLGIGNTFTVVLGWTQLLERKIRLGQDIPPEQMLLMLNRIRQHARVAHGLVQSCERFHWQRLHPPTK